MSTLKVNNIKTYEGDNLTIGTDANTVVTVTGDLHVDGDTVYNNVTNVTVQDPLMDIGGGVDGAAPGSDDNKDRGIVFQYYSGSAKKGFFGWDDSAGKFTFIADATVNSEVVSGDAGDVAFGSLSISGFDCDGAAVFNESGNNVDFRVESDGNANMLFVDGGENRVGIGTGTPATNLDVFGNVQIGNGGGGAHLLYNATNLYFNNVSNGIEASIINGKFGIGTTSPSTLLEVSGVVTATGFTIGSAAITETELEILDGATVTTTELNIMDGDTAATSTTLADADRVVVNDGGTMKQVALTDFEVYFESVLDTLPNVTSVGTLSSLTVSGDVTVDTDTLKVDSSSDRVGIGTTSPETTLHVQDGSAGTIAATAGTVLILESNEKPKLQFQSPGAYGGTIVFGSPTDNDEGQIDYDHGSDRLLFKTGGNTKMAILGDNVGVGVSDPDSKLEVAGKIHISAEQGSAPSAPSDGDGGFLYTKADGKIYWRSNELTETDLTTSGGGMTSFILEDHDGTEVSISDAEEVKFIGSGVTINWTDTSDGSDGDPFDLTFTVDAAQTGITSLLATDIKIGEDDQTKIDFEDANKINFYANNNKKVILEGSELTPGANDGTALGSAGIGWSDLYLADGGALYLGDDQDVTLTHVADTGLLLNGAMQIQFRDSDIHISSDADGDMQLRADSNVVTKIGATDRLTVSAAGINVNGAIVASDLHPTTADGGALGGASAEWGDLYLADGAVIYFGDDQEITMTHVPDTGLTLTSSASTMPLFEVKNTTNDANGARLRFVKDKGAAGADNDVCGIIEFYGDDDNQDNIMFAKIEGIVADASNGDECGKLAFYVAENDGNNTVGLSLTGSTTDGEVDVTIGAGVASTTTVAGLLLVTDDLLLNSDSSIISMGAGADATFIHDGTTGLIIAATPISIDSTGELHLNSTTGDIKLQDGGVDQIAFDLDGTANEVIMKAAVDGDDLVFSQYDGNECARVLDGESSVPSNAAGVAYGLGFKIPVYSINSTSGARAVTLTHKQGDSIIQCNASNNSGGDITITLPAIDAVGKQGVQYTVTLTSANASNRLVKILTTGADGNDKFVGFGFNGSTSYSDTDGGDTVTIGNSAILGTTVRVTNLSSGAGNNAEVWLVEAFGTAAVTID